MIDRGRQTALHLPPAKRLINLCIKTCSLPKSFNVHQRAVSCTDPVLKTEHRTADEHFEQKKKKKTSKSQHTEGPDLGSGGGLGGAPPSQPSWTP